MFTVFFSISAGIFGLAVGSFLNVVIYRVPRGQSIVHPPSACPACGRSIRPWENIPIISYLVLRGRCAGCRASISIQYPMVELTTGLLFAAVALQYGPTFETLIYCVFSAMLTALSVIDLQTKLLPDSIVLPGLIGACILAVARLHPQMGAYWDIGPLQAFLGMAAGGLPLLLLAWGYERLTGREGMGGGDIKLMFFVGALLGPGRALLTLFIGSFSGAVIGSIILRMGNLSRNTQIPFGPFLSAAAWISMMWGDRIIRGYLMISDIGI